MAKRPVPLYDFAAFGQAIKAARTARKESLKDVSDAMNISPRYLTNIENKGQQPSLQIFYELVTRYNISVDQFFFPNRDAEKSTQRRQLDALQAMGAAIPALLISMNRQGIIFIPALFILQAVIGMTGLVWAQPVADVLSILIAAILFGKTMKKCSLCKIIFSI